MALGTDAGGDGLGRRRVGQPRERRNSTRRRIDNHPAGGAGVLQDAALATLDKLNRGVFLLNAIGTVCFANRAAEAMASGMNGLLVRRGRLQFESVEANAALEAFIKGDTAPEIGSLVLRVDGARRRAPYRVLVSPLETRPGHHGYGTGYCVFIYEPNGGHRPVPTVVLLHLYGLTAAEARLANELYGGRSLADSAVACGISVNTAKSVLKRIFTKCAVHSQSELLLLFSLGPRTL
jgi:DNA-binding CsgD family transcriptional regulator